MSAWLKFVCECGACILLVGVCDALCLATGVSDWWRGALVMATSFTFWNVRGALSDA